MFVMLRKIIEMSPTQTLNNTANVCFFLTKKLKFFYWTLFLNLTLYAFTTLSLVIHFSRDLQKGVVLHGYSKTWIETGITMYYHHIALVLQYGFYVYTRLYLTTIR